MALTIAVERGRADCAESVVRFVSAVESMTEYDLLGASRCHGWARLDVVAHVIEGWQEMLGGLVSPVDGPPTVDAASYWCAFAAEYGSRDAVEVLMSQRRRGAVYARPSLAVAQLKDVAAALTRGIDSVPDRMCLWQGQVFAMGDFLAVWAVENVVHHLDLAADTPVPGDALELARMTIEALAGQVLPSEWSDEHAVLIGTGRLPLPEKHSSLQSRLPALG